MGYCGFKRGRKDPLQTLLIFHSLIAVLTILYRTLPLYAGKCPVLSCLAPMPLCLTGSAARDAGVSTGDLHASIAVGFI